MNLNNTVIEVLDKEHGLKVKKFFQDNGISTNNLNFSENKEDNDTRRYYGLISNELSLYSLAQAKSAGAKIMILPEESTRNTKIPLYQFKNGDYVVCKNSDEANSLIQLLKDNEYSSINKTESFNILLWNQKHNKFEGCNNSSYYFLNKEIPKEDFVALVTGNFPKYWYFYYMEDPNSKEALNILNQKYNVSWSGRDNQYYRYDGIVDNNGTDWHSDPYLFKNNPFRLTREYIINAHKLETTKIEEVVEFRKKEYTNFAEEGYRFLQEGEVILESDEWLEKGKWHKFVKDRPFTIGTKFEKSYCPHRRKITKTQNMKTQTISKTNLKLIHDIACSSWQTKLESKAKENPWSDSVEFTEEEVKEIFKASTPAQLPLGSRFFIKPVEKKLNIITRIPIVGTFKDSVESRELRINDEWAASILDEGSFSKESIITGHGPSLFLANCNGNWYDENERKVYGYLYWKSNLE